MMYLFRIPLYRYLFSFLLHKDVHVYFNFDPSSFKFAARGLYSLQNVDWYSYKWDLVPELCLGPWHQTDLGSSPLVHHLLETFYFRYHVCLGIGSVKGCVLCHCSSVYILIINDIIKQIRNISQTSQTHHVVFLSFLGKYTKLCDVEKKLPQPISMYCHPL